MSAQAARETDVTADRRVGRRWLAHAGILVALALAWLALLISVAATRSSGPLAGLDWLPVVLAGGLWLGYALLSTLAMACFARYRWGAALAHGGVVALFALVALVGSQVVRNRAREAERAAREAQIRWAEVPADAAPN